MTSRLRAAQRREQRRAAKPNHPRQLVKHGICTGCSRRREIVLPGKLCDRCCQEKA